MDIFIQKHSFILYSSSQIQASDYAFRNMGLLRIAKNKRLAKKLRQPRS
jgi:hypothetical protein